ncbi:ankyrin repeat domain-containing protein [archaeon]|nr:MAG: ankyrin repeat domain-containing protein [archaeon]
MAINPLLLLAFVLFACILVRSFNPDHDFLKAAGMGDAKLLKELLAREGNKRPSISARNNYGVRYSSSIFDAYYDMYNNMFLVYSAILFAANNGHLESVRLLLDHGAYINDRSNNGKTPVLWAALWGHKSVVEHLIERKANLNITDKEELTLVMSAVLSGNVRLLQRVLQENVNVTATNVYNGTALSIARAKGQEEMVRILTPYFDPPLLESPYLQFMLTAAYYSKLGVYEMYKTFSVATKGWENWNIVNEATIPQHSPVLDEASATVDIEL